MIGMSQIKRKFFIGLGAGLGVGALVTLGVSMYCISVVNSYKDGTNEKYRAECIRNVTVISEDVIQGQVVTDDMLTTVEMHKSFIPEGKYIDSVGDNMVAKYSIGANTALTPSMLAEDLPDKDLRETEYNTILMPTNLVEGEYVDIRIQFPNGTDYVVLPELQVKQILNETIWFDLTEEQRSLMNSAIVDTYLNEGTKLYALEYVDQSQITTYEKEIEKVVKGNLSELIKEELPELYTAEYSDVSSARVEEMLENGEKLGEEKKEENAEETTEEKTEDSEEFDWLIGEERAENVLENETTDAIDEEKEKLTDKLSAAEKEKYDAAVAAEKAEMIYNFIVKYRNVTACTTHTVQTYQPTAIVNDAMVLNPNITKEAIAKLNEDVRANIEELNNRMNDGTEEAEENIEKLIEGAQTSIEAQKEQRNEVMSVETVE